MKYSNDHISQFTFFNTIPTTESIYQISMNIFENSANKNVTVYSNNFYEKFNCNLFVAKSAFPTYFEKRLDFLFSQKIKDEIYKKLIKDYPILKSVEGLIKRKAELNFEKLSFDSSTQESFYLLDHKDADRSEKRRKDVLEEIKSVTLAINEKIKNINLNILYVPSLNSKNIDIVRNFLCKPINIRLSIPPPNPVDSNFYENLLQPTFSINLHDKNSQILTINVSPIIGYTFSRNIANSMENYMDIEIHNIDKVKNILPDLISLKKVTLKYSQYPILKEISEIFKSIYLKNCIKCFETNLIDLNRAIEKVAPLIHIQKELFSINEKNFDEICVFVNLLIQDPNLKNEISHQITNASRYNPIQEKLYRQLVLSVQNRKENLDFRPKIWSYKFYPIEKILIKDDIDSFQNYISRESVVDLNSQLYHCNCLKKNLNLIQMSCFYGAILCFKYLISCDVKYTESKLMKFAIAGGNIGIIHILHKPENKIIPKARQIAALFHRNTILEWLVDQEIDRSYYLESAAISNNFYAAKIYCEEVFGNFIEKAVSYSEMNSMVYTWKITSALQKSIKYDHQNFFCFILNFPNVDFSDINSNLLVTAMKCKNIKIIELILNFGDSIFQNSSIEKIQDTLLAAIKTANTDIVNKIYGFKSVRRAIEGRIDRNEEFANDIIYSGNKEIIRKFIHFGNIFHYPYAIENILSQLVYMNDINSIENVVDKDYFRIRQDWSPFPSANTVEMVCYLLDCQSNVDYCDVDGKTCLSNAIKNENIDVIITLLENGATVRASDYEAASPEIKKIL